TLQPMTPLFYRGLEDCHSSICRWVYGLAEGGFLTGTEPWLEGVNWNGELDPKPLRPSPSSVVEAAAEAVKSAPSTIATALKAATGAASRFLASEGTNDSEWTTPNDYTTK